MKRCDAIGIVVLAAGWFAWSAPASAQEAAEPSKPKLIGAENCAQCHYAPAGNPFLSQPPGLARYTECDEWFANDRHQRAYAALESERGVQMAKLYGKDVTKAAECLSCHGVDPTKFVANFPDPKIQGVTCSVCHGAEGEWLDLHSKPEWRQVYEQERVAQTGLVEVRDRVIQARLCASCHVGDAGENKIVTHEMYAAGHPPLPSFELATYNNQMPPHWESVESIRARAAAGDLSESDQKSIEQALSFIDRYTPAGEAEETTSALIGAVVSFQQTVRIARDGAEATPESIGGAWPRLEAFDCYACHHDLQRKSWRQAASSRGVPGRPRPATWPRELVRIACRVVDGSAAGGGETEKRFDAILAESEGVFDRQPFGRSGEVVAAAEKADRFAEELLSRLRETTVDRPVAETAFRATLDRAQGRLIDFDSARQLAWFARTSAADAFPSVDPETAAGFASLEEQFQLTFRTPKGTESERFWIVDERLQRSLEDIADYGPEDFQRAMAELGQAVLGTEAASR